MSTLRAILVSICLASPAASQQWTRFTTADGLAGDSVWFIREDGRGYLWFVSAFDGASRYDGIRFQRLNSARGLASDNIYFTRVDGRGHLWFATDRGVSRYDGRNFLNLDVRDGLAGDNVTFIAEDGRGHLWFATDRGVSRYDGRNFLNFDLSGVAVSCVLEDRKDRLWVGTTDGLFRYGQEAFAPVPVPPSCRSIRLIFEDRRGDLWFGAEEGLCHWPADAIAPAGPLLEYPVSSILEDSRGDLWLAGDRGLVQYESGRGGFSFPRGWDTRTVLAMQEDSRGDLWFGTDQGLFRRDGKGNQHRAGPQGKELRFVRAIWQDRDGNLWFGTEEGVYRYAAEELRHFTTRDGLAADAVNAVLEDDAGDLWFGTERGLCRFDGERFHDRALPGERPDSRILALCQDRQGTLWIGTAAGVYRDFRPVDDPQLRTAVRAIREDEMGNVWLAAATGLVRYDGQAFRGFSVEDGSEIFPGSGGSLWMGTWDAGLLRFDQEGNAIRYTMDQGLASHHVTWIMETSRGEVWCGLKGGIPTGDGEAVRGGACRFDGSSFAHFGLEDGLPSERLTAAAEDREGIVWFGTDRGIAKFDRRASGAASPFTVLTTADGLISNYVTAVFVDRSGRRWFGTDRGVSKFDGENFQNIFLREDRKYSFVENILEDSRKHLWFVTTRDGVFRYAPPAKESGPRVHIDQVEADRIYADGFEGIEIPSTARRVTFAFMAISFKGKPVRFTYKLEGRDRDWQPSTYDLRVHYEGLEPGDYRFSVKAIDENLHYSQEPAVAAIAVFRPFYLTWWFIVMALAGGGGGLGGAIYLGVQLREQRRTAARFRQRLRRQEEAERIQVAKMESLRQFVAGVAHEVNNPVGAIVGSTDVSGRAVGRLKALLSAGSPGERIETEKLGRILAALEDASRTTRTASERIARIVINLQRFVRLDEAEWKLVDVHEGLDTVVSLLEPEFVDRVEFVKEYGHLPLVFCSLSSLNQAFMAAFRNACEAVEGKGVVKARTWVQEEEIGIEISDTGKGIAPEDIDRIFDPGFTTKDVKVGVGLGLAIFYKIVVDEHKGRIEVASRPKEGTRLVMYLPRNPGRRDVDG